MPAPQQSQESTRGPASNPPKIQGASSIQDA